MGYIVSCFLWAEATAHCICKCSRVHQNLNLTSKLMIVILHQEAALMLFGWGPGVKGRHEEFLTCSCLSAHFALPPPETTLLLLLSLLLLLLCVVVFRSECLAAG